MPPSVHPVDELLPLPKLFALGLQYVLVMYANAVAMPLHKSWLGMWPSYRATQLPSAQSADSPLRKASDRVEPRHAHRSASIRVMLGNRVVIGDHRRHSHPS
jgi:hypothetical protein